MNAVPPTMTPRHDQENAAPGSATQAKHLQTREIAAKLNETYGPRPWRRHLPPVDELVATILSQHTSDTNTARAFSSLKSAFPIWDAVIDASPSSIVDAIRSGGLANQKAPRIQSALAAIRARYGSFNFDHLAGLSVAAARAELTEIRGVGPKTASCVLLFSLGMPALPVDTHVFRVTKRMGIIEPQVSAESAHEILELQLRGNRDEVYAFHMHLIQHGRAVCAARRPACERCTLIDRCLYGQTVGNRAPE